MKLSESIEKQLKEFDKKEGIDIQVFSRDDFDKTKDFIRTAIKQAILDIVPEERKEEDCDCGGYESCGCAVDDYNACRSELLKRINE